ncbi:MAG: hypothetical protein WCK67_11875 [bacterium]
MKFINNYNMPKIMPAITKNNDKINQTKEISFSRQTSPAEKITNFIEEADKRLTQAKIYLDLATKEKDYNLKHKLAAKGLGYIDKAEILNKKAVKTDLDEVLPQNRDETIRNTYVQQGNKIRKVGRDLTKQFYAAAISPKAYEQMKNYTERCDDFSLGESTSITLNEDFEKGFIYSSFEYDKNGLPMMNDYYRGYINNAKSTFPVYNIQINLEDDPVLVKASQRLNENLNNIDKADSMEVSKTLLNTVSEFFKPELIVDPIIKNETVHYSCYNENAISINGNAQYYSDFKQNHLPTRLTNIGEFSEGGFGTPKATATCINQSLFLKAIAQLSDIHTTLVDRKSHAWLEYNSDDGKKFVIDPRNKLIFDLTDKTGTEYDIYNKTFTPISKDECNNIFEKSYNINGEGYQF